jgi:signal transduction histidine kinase
MGLESKSSRSGKSKTAARKKLARLWRIAFSIFVAVAFLVVIVVMIVRGSDPAQVRENLAILCGILVAIGIVAYLSPGTQEAIKRRRKEWEHKQEQEFWAQRDVNDQKQAEAQARVAEERRRKREERERLAQQAAQEQKTKS